MRPFHPSGRIRRGFTLIELLAVIAIIGVLIGLLLPAVQSAREAARRAQCLNNLKQVGLALQTYHSVMEVFPPGYVAATVDNKPDGAELGPGWGWAAMMLPYMEQARIFDSINFSLLIRSPASVTARVVNISSLLCPSDSPSGPVTVADASGKVLLTDLAPSQYVGTAGQFEVGDSPANNNGIFFRNSRVGMKDITDGASQTMMAGERTRRIADATWTGVIPEATLCTKPDWYVNECDPPNALVLGHTGPTPGGDQWIDTPNNRRSGPDDYSSRHPGGANFVFADGSVRFVRDSIDPRVFSALSTRSRGEVVSADRY